MVDASDGDGAQSTPRIHFGAEHDALAVHEVDEFADIICVKEVLLSIDTAQLPEASVGEPRDHPAGHTAITRAGCEGRAGVHVGSGGAARASRRGSGWNSGGHDDPRRRAPPSDRDDRSVVDTGAPLLGNGARAHVKNSRPSGVSHR